MTEMRDSTEGRVAERRAGNEVTREMRSVDHTHPITDEPFGPTFNVTVTPVADGGEADCETDPDCMADVDHESPDGAGADAAYKRGTEGRDETV
jgi:hypothetical protein